MEHAWNESLVAKIKLTGNYQDYIIVLLENLGFEAYRSIHKVLNDDGDINIDWIAYQFAEYAKENFTYEYGIVSKCKINGKLYNIQNAIKSVIKGTGDNIINDLGFIAYLSKDIKQSFVNVYTGIIRRVLELHSIGKGIKDLHGYFNGEQLNIEAPDVNFTAGYSDTELTYCDTLELTDKHGRKVYRLENIILLGINIEKHTIKFRSNENFSTHRHSETLKYIAGKNGIERIERRGING